MPFSHEKGMKAVKDTAIEAGRGLSSGLMGSAFESFGKAFDGGGYTPRGYAPDRSYLNNWREMGAKTQQALENRWHMAEFKTFRKTHLNQFQEAVGEELERSKYLNKELSEGRWHISEGNVEELDMSNEADRMKALRYKSQVEGEVMSRIADLQIGLNNAAAERYYNNPIVGNMLQSMMMKQTEMLAGQFQAPNSMKQALQEQKLEGGAADIDYKKALTEQAKAQTTRLGEKYKSTDAVIRDLGPAQARRYFANHVDGKALLEMTEFPNHLQRLEQQAAADFIKRQKWDPQTAGLEANRNATQAFVTSEAPRIRQRAMYEWMKKEYGQDVADAAAKDSPGMLEDVAPPFEYDVKTMPSKKEVKKKTDKWDALGVEKANEEMRRNPDMSKEEAKQWLMEEWLPEALNGTDIAEGGAYLPQFDGLTADAKNKAAAPYIKAVRDSLKKALKWIGSGPGTEQLLPEQRRVPRTGRRSFRSSRPERLGRAAGSFLDRITPDALFPETGKGLYPPDFRKEFPQDDEDTEE